ncbi:50S ribosomal protein L19 [Candidatus Dependentiae bacterium]|nr:50S ribosomal protein L19 [Candidatus Dependentiae bacterium]
MKAKNFTKETIKNIGISSDKKVFNFAIGDMVAVSQWVKEEKDLKEDKKGKNSKVERIQIFEGNVIARKNNGMSSTFTVRKIGKDGIAIERIYPLYSPNVESVKVITKSKVRRAKLYYLRNAFGKKSKIKEKIEKKSKSLVSAE